MGLILTRRQGEDFYVEDTRFRVSQVFDNRHFVLKTDQGDLFEITGTRMAEVMPDVWVSAGDRADHSHARVVIEAPREIKLLRGEKWRQQWPETPDDPSS